MASFDFSKTCDAFSGSEYRDITQVDYVPAAGWSKDVDFTKTRPIRKSSIVDRGSFARLATWPDESSYYNGVHAEFSDNFKPGTLAYPPFPLKDLGMWFNSGGKGYSTTWWTAITLSTSYDRVFNGIVKQSLQQKVVLPQSVGKAKSDLSLYLDMEKDSLTRSITGFNSVLRSLTGITDQVSGPNPYEEPKEREGSSIDLVKIQKESDTRSSTRNQALLDSVVRTINLHIGHDNLKAEKIISFKQSYNLLVYISSRLNIKECDDCLAVLKRSADDLLLIGADASIYQKPIDLSSLFYCHVSITERMRSLQKAYHDFNLSKCTANASTLEQFRTTINESVRDIFNYHRLIALNLIYLLTLAIVLDYFMVKRNPAYKSYFTSTISPAKYLQETVDELSVMTRRLAAAYTDLALSQGDISLTTEESNAAALDIQAEAQVKVLGYLNVSLVRVVQLFIRVASAGVYSELNGLL